MRTVSFSKIRDFLLCPQLFKYFHIEKLVPFRSQLEAHKGTSFHNYLSLHAKDVDIPYTLSPQEDIMWEYYQEVIHAFQGLNPFSEWDFYLPLQIKDEKILISGQIDRLYRQENTLILIEWKTGQAHPLDIKQIQFYSWILWQLRELKLLDNIENIEAHLVYLAHSKTQVTLYNRDLLLPLHKEFVDILKKMNPSIYTFLPHPLVDSGEPWCKVCYFKKACVEGKRYYEKLNLPIKT